MKPIETVYNGYKFRSRLEARWAVFFDTLGIEYQYEPEGFDLDGEWYLPDFWIPQWYCWVEIKPEKPKFCKRSGDRGLEIITRREYTLCQKLAEESRCVVMLIGGTPFVKEVPFVDEFVQYQSEYTIALFCPDMIMDGWGDCSPTGIEFELYIDAPPMACRLLEQNFVLSSGLYGFIFRQYKEHPEYFTEPLPHRGDVQKIIEADKVYYQKVYKSDHPSWYYGIAQTDFIFEYGHGLKLSPWGDSPGHNAPHPLLVTAYTAARQARFGHNGRG